MRQQEAELAREREREQRQLQQQEAELQRAREQEQFRLYEQKVELERAREQERLQILQQEAELQRQRQEQEADLQRRREVELLQILAQEHQLKRQQEEDGVGITLRLEQGRSDTALEFRRQELQLESPHLSQRREAEANLPVCFKPTNCIKMMPPFVEAEVDSFFVSFEALATQLQWPRTQLSIRLRSHLTGRDALTLSTLAKETDYDVLKQAVLDAYVLSTESYRRRFKDYIKTQAQTNVECYSKPSWSSQASPEVSRKVTNYALYCRYCRTYGHLIEQCPNLKCKTTSTVSTKPKHSPTKPTKPILHVNVPVSDLALFDRHVYPGTVSANGEDFEGKSTVRILRDTASLQSILLKAAAPQVAYTGETVLITDLTATTSYPLATVYLECPFIRGKVQVAIREKPFPMPGIPLFLGNDLANHQDSTNLITCEIPQVCDSATEEHPAMTFAAEEEVTVTEESADISQPVLVTTRAQAAQPQQVAAAVPQDVRGLPPNLNSWSSIKTDAMPGFYIDTNQLLYRRYRPSKLKTEEDWADLNQLVVPTSLRKDIISLAHGPMSHYGIHKTYNALLQDYFRPGMTRDVKSYVTNCHTCQMAGKPDVGIPKAPLIPISVPSEPFTRLVIDCVEPLPKTHVGNMYIITIMCPTTRFPIAVPIKNITAATVVKHLLKIFTQYGFPKEIQSDCGTNFTTELFKKTLQELNITEVLSSPYHPASQGSLERSQQTIKSLLKKYCIDTEKDWDKQLDRLMCIFRSLPNESLGVSPYEMLYGRKCRGPLKAFKDSLTSTTFRDSLNVPQFLKNLKHNLEQLHKFASANLPTHPPN
ncbi:uncharacterized protein [Procambarus clarkii]|uniref:uncharacterized protein n=1 Tax=Procambarus clarkii TaxID=6728 RepID=UPI00374441E5